MSHVMIEPLTMSLRLADNDRTELPALIAVHMAETLRRYRCTDLVLNFFLFD